MELDEMEEKARMELAGITEQDVNILTYFGS